jgi:2-oxoisovalerate dehydrogenase E1 component
MSTTAPAAPAAHGVAPEELLADLHLAHVSRAIDDREINLQKQSRVFFQISGAGHEALGVALARCVRPGHDWFFPYYRDTALMLGLGVSARDILLQAVGAADDPSSGGRQMPAHWGFPELHVMTTSSPTGSQCLPGVGCAEAGRYLADHPALGASRAGAPDEITVVSLGEGACSEGEFWESLNTACTLRLPVLYLVANNGFAISVPERDQHPARVSELVRGFAGLEIAEVDGCDYLAARAVLARVVDHVRAHRGPALVEAHVIRPYSHSAADTQAKYRTGDELEQDAAHDPLRLMGELAVRLGACDAAGLDAIRAAARAEVDAATAVALAAPRPDPATVLDYLVAPLSPVEEGPVPSPAEAEAAGVPVLTMGDALNATLHAVMRDDEAIRVFGEDVADARPELLGRLDGKGGVFGTTRGLQRVHGSDRCFNTPLAEANIVGRAVGQALRGLRPIPEIQFFDYIWPAMQQLRSEVATTRWRSNGRFTCPMVVRVAIGGYLTGGAIWHSQSGEAIFAHVPGLRIAFPSTAADAAGLLRTAVGLDDPVLFLEHKHLLRHPDARSAVPDGHRVPFGRLARRRVGRHLTIVSWGETVHRSVAAAAVLAEADGVEIEVLDLRTLAPWDREGVLEAVRRTNRLLVVHEDTLTAGFGAEIAAVVGEHGFEHLDAPVGRVGAKDTWVGYEPGLEAATLPQVDDIVAAARRSLAW